MFRYLTNGAFAFVGMIVLLSAGCESAYYGAWERVGVYKRDILVDRVENAMEAQEDAKEEFRDALEEFSSVVTVPPSKLKSTYVDLNSAFEASQARADEVSDRIEAVESVSGALFDEWQTELTQIGNAKLRASSARQLRESKRKYAELIRSMRRAESRMGPVLNVFRDHVLFLKHNLNARAIASLKSELENGQWKPPSRE